MTLATATRQTWSVLIILKIKNHAQLPQILDILPTLLRIYGIVGNQLVSLVFCGIAAVQSIFTSDRLSVYYAGLYSGVYATGFGGLSLPQSMHDQAA